MVIFAKNIYKIFHSSVSSRAFSYLSVLLLLAALFPLLLLAGYAHPSADDFSYGAAAHRLFVETGSVPYSILHGSLFKTKLTYSQWQGNFSSVFMFTIGPAVWNEKLYFITPVIMLFMIIAPIFALLHVLSKRVFHFRTHISVAISSILSFIVIEQFHWPFEGLYWYNGAVHYVFMNGCLLFFLAAMLEMVFQNKTGFRILLLIFSSILAVFVGGGNFSSALLCAVLLVLSFIAALLYAFTGFLGKDKLYIKRLPFLIPPAFIFFAAMIISITAPGNLIRQASYTKLSPLQSVILSFRNVFTDCDQWFTSLLLICLVSLIPIIWVAAAKSSFRFRLPLFVTVFSFLLLTVMYVPNYYATGEMVLARVTNIVKIMFHLFAVLNLIYWVGWLQKKLKYEHLRDTLLFYIVLVLLVLYNFASVSGAQRERDFISYGAYSTIVTGQAQEFHTDYLHRLSIYAIPERDSVVPPFRQYPFMLYSTDITSDAWDWRNRAVAEYYHKWSVKLIDESKKE